MQGPNPTGFGSIISNWKMGSLYISKMIYTHSTHVNLVHHIIQPLQYALIYYELISLVSIEVVEYPL
jgi:hypothetical protein